MKNNITKIAIFASGNGSNFEAIASAVESGSLQAEIVLLVVDRANCYALKRAENHHIDTFSIDPKEYSSKAAYEAEIVKQLQQKEVEWIFLAGYMRIVGSILLQNFPNKIVNIHPALLPSFPGLHAIEQAFNYGVKIFGITIHYVDEGVDTGKIIAQNCFHLTEQMTVEEVEVYIHQLEHQLYPKTIQKLIECKKK